MTSIRLEHISKQFGATVALEGIDLSVAAGELFFLLGPSGCGKSTLLRLIAGLHDPTAGRVLFNDRDVTRLGTERRNAVMVFQSYALWPHMTVRQNVRFGLNVRRLPRSEQDARIDQVLKLVQLEKLGDRRPNQLSGGQQQRVALARALAVRPDCLLLDEPLSNLDAKLRQEMRNEIRRICKSQHVTTIYVTHDQKEALSVADRIAVMNAGRVVQVGTPADLYHRPADAFVADFIGQTNLLEGRATESTDGQVSFVTPIGPVRTKLASDAPRSTAGVTLSIRPEQIRILPDGIDRVGPNTFTGRVVETTFLGEASEHFLDIGGRRVRVISTPPRFDAPAEMTIAFAPEDVFVLPPGDAATPAPAGLQPAGA